MQKFSVSLPVSAMIAKQGKNFTMAKIFKKVCKTLFVTVTILSPDLLLNDCCFKIIVDTRKIAENFHMKKVTFLHHFCCWLFPIQIFEHIALIALLMWRYVITSTLKCHWHYHIWQTVQRCIVERQCIHKLYYFSILLFQIILYVIKNVTIFEINLQCNEWKTISCSNN